VFCDRLSLERMRMITLDEKKVEQIERKARIARISDIAAYLQDKLGQKITAYLSGLKDPKVVGSWAKGRGEPRDLAAFRLRCAYEAALMLVEAYGPETAKSWFFGTNTRLDDEAPAYLLRHVKTPEDLRFIIPSARAFVGAAE
jgi:hypothetical protein